MDNYEGDHAIMDKGGNWHSVARVLLTSDGNGEKRAYGHIITGEQHVTSVISLITGDPIVVWHDQISCIGCWRKLTEFMSKSKRRPFVFWDSNLYARYWAFHQNYLKLSLHPSKEVCRAVWQELVGGTKNQGHVQ